MTTEAQLEAGRAYQRTLLDALGRDDPSEVQSVGPRDARALVVEAGADLRTRPAPREWSVLLCLAHLADAELVMAGRYRWVLAHDRPELPGYDQDLWVDNLHTDDDDPESLLGQYGLLRTGNIELWRGTDAAQRHRVSVHGERGEESLDLMFRMLAGHDRVHLAQAGRALEAVRR
ncbi:MAG TPA: DinB family protein [Candidatus Limnocylindria bacterium]|nr:DinB family protein [Candidatus Limnocylindria bacterium]